MIIILKYVIICQVNHLVFQRNDAIGLIKIDGTENLFLRNGKIYQENKTLQPLKI